MSDEAEGAELMLLFDIYQEVRSIRQHLEDAGDDVTQAFCIECREVVHEDDIESHAERTHNWHTALGDDLLDKLYVHDDDGE
jgi:DNA replication initiation complex subunit (GINS family)